MKPNTKLDNTDTWSNDFAITAITKLANAGRTKLVNLLLGIRYCVMYNKFNVKNTIEEQVRASAEPVAP